MLNKKNGVSILFFAVLATSACTGSSEVRTSEGTIDIDGSDVDSVPVVFSDQVYFESLSESLSEQVNPPELDGSTLSDETAKCYSEALLNIATETKLKEVGIDESNVGFELDSLVSKSEQSAAVINCVNLAEFARLYARTFDLEAEKIECGIESLGFASVRKRHLDQDKTLQSSIKDASKNC